MDCRFMKPEKLIPEEGFIPDRRIVIAVLLNSEGEMVLFRRGDKNKFFPGYFHILTEKLEGEEDFTEGLIRGVFEEAGIEISEDEFFKMGERDFTKWGSICSEVDYYCVMIGEKNIRLNSEHTEYLLAKPSEVENLKITPTVISMLERLEEFSPSSL
jgi:ADP-ribose pyrophosphatase YjhB (NUDIX family)